jgi:hypothetical protein
MDEHHAVDATELLVHSSLIIRVTQTLADGDSSRLLGKAIAAEAGWMRRSTALRAAHLSDVKLVAKRSRPRKDMVCSSSALLHWGCPRPVSCPTTSVSTKPGFVACPCTPTVSPRSPIALLPWTAGLKITADGSGCQGLAGCTGGLSRPPPKSAGERGEP